MTANDHLEREKYARQIRRLLKLIETGRPCDPRDCEKWDREICRAEKLLAR